MKIPLKPELFRLPLPWQLRKDAWFAVNSLPAYLITGLITYFVNSQRMALLWPGLAGATLTSPRCHRHELQMQTETPPKSSWFSRLFSLSRKGYALCGALLLFLSATKAFDRTAEVISESLLVHGVTAPAPRPHRAAHSNKQLLKGSVCLCTFVRAKIPNYTFLKGKWSRVCTRMSMHAHPFVRKDFIYSTLGKFYIFICEQFSSFSNWRGVMSHGGELTWIINIQSWCWSWINEAGGGGRGVEGEGEGGRLDNRGTGGRRDVKTNLQI